MNPLSGVSLILQALLLGSLVLLACHSIRRKYYEWKSRLPGAHSTWWNPFGQELEAWLLLMKSESRTGEFGLQYLRELIRRYKEYPLFMVWVANIPCILVTSYESLDFVLGSTKILRKSNFYNLLHNWLGTGLLTSDGSKWRSRRRILTPAFHFHILEDFLDVFNEQAIILADIFKARRNSEESFELTQHVTYCTLDIICETAMGVQIKAQTNPKSAYVSALYAVGETFIERFYKPFLWRELIFKLTMNGRRTYKCLEVMHNFTMNVIKERHAKIVQELAQPVIEPNFGQKVRKPLLNLLLERNIKEQDFSFRDIQEEVDTFMFEGHDTTAMAISWTLFLLAENPHIQEKVLAELNGIFDGDQTRYATNDDLAGMKYLECCIKESLRLYPSVPFIGREFHEDVKYKDLVIPAGTQLGIVVYDLHRDKNVFPDPEKFDPDRFLPENCEGRHPYAYIPFSAGPRNCIGQRFAIMEEKVVLSWILRKVSLATTMLRKDVPVLMELVTRPRDGLYITTKAR